MTLAWGPDPAVVASAIASTTIPATAFKGDLVGLGTTGDHGTVLKGRDLGLWNVSRPDPAGCEFTTR